MDVVGPAADPGISAQLGVGHCGAPEGAEHVHDGDAVLLRIAGQVLVEELDVGQQVGTLILIRKVIVHRHQVAGAPQGRAQLCENAREVGVEGSQGLGDDVLRRDGTGGRIDQGQ